MRTVNFQLARFINKYFERDSQAIRERYKSPVVNDVRYQINVMQYIWLNRFKADRSSNPETDRFCSAAWRINPGCIKHITTDREKIELFESLLDPYSSLQEPLRSVSLKNEKKMVRKLLKEALAKVESYFDKIFHNSHTIGDAIVVKARGSILNAFKRTYSPIV